MRSRITANKQSAPFRTSAVIADKKHAAAPRGRIRETMFDVKQQSIHAP
jgi:hypothetical protein